MFNTPNELFVQFGDVALGYTSIHTNRVGKSHCSKLNIMLPSWAIQSKELACQTTFSQRSTKIHILHLLLRTTLFKPLLLKVRTFLRSSFRHINTNDFKRHVPVILQIHLSTQLIFVHKINKNAAFRLEQLLKLIKVMLFT